MSSQPATAGRSLKGRALAYLSRREHSRAELQQKLAPHAESAEQLTALLDCLEREKWLSTPRFVESLLNRKATRLGKARLLQELRTHQVDETTLRSLEVTLNATEMERAQAVWLRKFGQPPADVREHARQVRFLIARGFASSLVHRIVGRPPSPSQRGSLSVAPDDDC